MLRASREPKITTKLQGAHPPEAVGTSLELVTGSLVDAVGQIELAHPPFGYDVYQGSHYPPHRRSSARSRWHFLWGTDTGRTGYCNNDSR